MDYRSVLAGGPHRGDVLMETVYPRMLARFPVKFWWFQQHGYVPHVWQALFHGADHDEKLTRFRHLVAGRRGGKTLSAAWEILFYSLHPTEFHRDAHGIESDRALWIWVLTKDYPTGHPSLVTLLEVMRQAGLVKGRDYQYNKVDRRIEFIESGTVIQFKTAEDPQSLRGAGLDILWMDEAAFIDNGDAYLVTSPALGTTLGLVITTTTPHGKNWLWDEFFAGEALTDPNEFRVQYTSIDSPYFPREEWERYRKRYHPIHFRQEFLASFDAFTGIALQGEWLKYWVAGNPDVKTGDVSLKPYMADDGRYRLKIYMAVDPAISLADTADYFAMAIIGMTEDRSQLFLLDLFKGRVPFPDQVDLIREWHLKWRPELIGIESNAFQRSLYDMASRLDTIPNVIPVFSKGDKRERILRMSPLFKYGKVRINKRFHADFVEQWINFDPEKKNQEDDVLDAVEIALGTAGVLLAEMPHASLIDDPRPENPHEVARAQIRAMRAGGDRPTDPEMGSEW